MFNKGSHHRVACGPVCCLLATLMVSACHAPQKNNLALSFAGVPTPSGVRVDRRIGWLPLIDARHDPAAVGQIGLDTYAAASVDVWVTEALQGLTKESFKAVAIEPSASELCIQPTLIRLYLQNVDITKSAHAVLRLEFFPPGQPSFSKLYRGRHTAINWWDSNAEMSRALHLALQDCLKQIAADLVSDSFRQGIQTEASPPATVAESKR